MKHALKLLVINYAILCAMVVGMEMLGQLLYFSRTGHVLFFEGVRSERAESDKLFEIHPFLAARPRQLAEERSGDVTITTTVNRTRWTGAPPDDRDLVRVAVFGGSTTFGTGVTDAESWPAQLQARLGKRFAVTNFGVPGYSTAEAIVQMTLLVPEWRPHVVVFYQGWNDIRNYHEPELGPDYYGHGMRQFENLEIPVFRADPRPVFALAWLARAIRTRLSGTVAPVAHVDAPRTDPDPFVDRIYLRNLQTLRVLAREIGAYGIFVPQVLNDEDFRGRAGARYWTRRIADDALPGLMTRFNGLLQGLCAAPEDACVVLDDSSMAGWTAGDFIDDGHFSSAGGARFSGLLASRILAWRADGLEPPGPR